MKSINYIKQLFSESIIYGFSGIVAKFLSFFLVPVYTRIFAPSDYGIIGLISNGVVLVSIVVVLGLDSAAARWIYDKSDIEYQKRVIASWAWCQLCLSLFVSGIVFLFADKIASLFATGNEAVTCIRIVCGFIPLSTLGTVATNWLRFRRRAWATVFFSLGLNLTTIVLTILFVVILRIGVSGVFYAQAISACVFSIVAIVMMMEWVSPLKFDLGILRAMLVYATPLIPGALSFWIVNLSGHYFIKAFSTTSEVGLYQVGISISSGVALLTNSFQQAWGPFALSIHSQEDSKKIYAEVFIYYMVIVCFVCTFVSLFARELLMILTTKSYYTASTIIGIFSFNYMIIGLGYIAVLGATLAKTTKPFGVSVMYAAVLTVFLNFLLVPRWGKEGAALASLVAQAIVPLYVFYASNKLYPIPYNYSFGFKIFLLSLSVFYISTLLPENMVVITALVKILLLCIYIYALFLFKFIRLEVISNLFKSFSGGDAR